MKKEALLNLKKRLVVASMFTTAGLSFMNNNIVSKASDNNEIVYEDIKKEDGKSASEYIKYYCNKFNLNYDEVYELLSKETNDFRTNEWKYGHTIFNNSFHTDQEAIYYATKYFSEHQGALENLEKEYFNSVDLEKSNNEYIKYYSNVFNLKYGKIKDKLYELTDNFNSKEWTYGFVINGRGYETKEEAIFKTIYNIYNNPEDFNLDRDEITSENNYTPELSAEEMISKYSKLFHINRDIALAIAYTECGSSMASANYLDNNNPAGLGPHMYFMNKEYGIIYFCNMLRNNCGCNEYSGTDFLNGVAPSYCPPGDSWLALSIPFYNNTSSDYLFAVPESEKINYNIDDYDFDVKTLNLKQVD